MMPIPTGGEGAARSVAMVGGVLVEAFPVSRGVDAPLGLPLEADLPRAAKIKSRFGNLKKRRNIGAAFPRINIFAQKGPNGWPAFLPILFNKIFFIYFPSIIFSEFCSIHASPDLRHFPRCFRTPPMNDLSPSPSELTAPTVFQSGAGLFRFA